MIICNERGGTARGGRGRDAINDAEYFEILEEKDKQRHSRAGKIFNTAGNQGQAPSVLARGNKQSVQHTQKEEKWRGSAWKLQWNTLFPSFCFAGALNKVLGPNSPRTYIHASGRQYEIQANRMAERYTYGRTFRRVDATIKSLVKKKVEMKPRPRKKSCKKL